MEPLAYSHRHRRGEQADDRRQGTGGDGSDGTAIIDIGTATSACTLLVDGDGAATVAALANAGNAVGGFALDPAGNLDTGFSDGDGSDGIFTVPLGGTNTVPTSIARQSSGALIIVGTTRIADVDQFSLRLTPAGDLDTTYSAGDGTDGFIILDPGNTDWAENVFVLPDDSTLLAGTTSIGGWHWSVTKFTPNGALDTTFSAGDGSDGIGMLDIIMSGTNHWLQQAALLPDGSVLTTGFVRNGAQYDVGFARIESDGSHYPGYTGGIGPSNGAVYDIGGASDYVYGLGLLSDGRLVGAGTTSNGGQNDILLMGLGSVTPAQYSGTDNWASVAPNDDMFGACLAAVGGGAAATGGSWALDTNGTSGDCAPDDADPWNPIAETSGDATAKVAESTVAGTITAQADISFGFRTAGNQPAGKYLAPVTLEAVAPNV